LRVTVGITAASTSDKDTAFSDLGTAIGNLDIASLATTRSGSGETLTTDGLANGFRDLGTSYTALLKLTSDNSDYTSNTVEISAKLDAAVDSSVTMTIKMVATDPANDTGFTSGNTQSVPADVKNTPKMVTTLFSIDPDTSQGLGTGLAPSSTDTVSNTIV